MKSMWKTLLESVKQDGSKRPSKSATIHVPGITVTTLEIHFFLYLITRPTLTAANESPQSIY